MTLNEIYNKLQNQWNSKERKMNWLEMEDVLVQILRLEIDNETKIALTKECIDAYTRRGHFGGKYFLKG